MPPKVRSRLAWGLRRNTGTILQSYSFLIMLLRVCVLSLVGLWGLNAALNAQVLPPTQPCASASALGSAIPACIQGSSFSYDMGQEFEQIASVFAEFGGVDGLFFKYSFSVTAGSLPAGLTLSPSGLLSGTLTSAGQFSFTLSVDFSLGVEGMTLFSESVPIPVTFAVAPYSGPAVTIDPSALNFNLTQNAAGVTQSVTITNHGNQALEFSASATTNSGGKWLALPSSGGSITAGGSFSLAVTADPAQLTAGHIFRSGHHLRRRRTTGHCFGAGRGGGNATEHSALADRSAIPGCLRRNRHSTADHHRSQSGIRRAELRGVWRPRLRAGIG